MSGPILRARGGVRVPRASVYVGRGGFFTRRDRAYSSVNSDYNFSCSTFTKDGRGSFARDCGFLPRGVSVLLMFSYVMISIVQGIANVAYHGANGGELFVNWFGSVFGGVVDYGAHVAKDVSVLGARYGHVFEV